VELVHNLWWAMEQTVEGALVVEVLVWRVVQVHFFSE
jgi:hypothetical protein